MKGKKFRRFTAGLLAAAMTCTASVQTLAAFPAVAADGQSAQGKVIFSTDFEDGSLEGFDKRGDDDTTELTVAETDAVSGSKALSAAGRTQSWNGPSFRIDQLLEPNKEYLLTASVKAKNYANITFSFQYTDAEGVTHYNNIEKDIQSGGWKKIDKVPFSYTADMKDVFIYFETNNTDDLFVDDSQRLRLHRSRMTSNLSPISSATISGLVPLLPPRICPRAASCRYSRSTSIRA